MTTARADSAAGALGSRPRTGVGRGPLLHTLASVPLGLAWTVLVAYAAAAAVVAFLLSPLIGGGLLVLAREGARAERQRARSLVGVPIPPTERPLPDRGFWRRVRAAAGDPASWRDLAYLALLGPTSLLAVAVPLALAGAAAFGLGALAWLPGTDVGLGPVPLGNVPTALVATGAGALLAVALPRALRGVVGARVWFTLGLLGPDAVALETRTAAAEAQRDLVRRVAAEERRRLERDLHDGAQQRLVRIGMELGMARRLRASDPARADELVSAAHDDAKLAIGELRALAQGIHPAALTEAGLGAAVAQLAGGAPVDVQVDVDLLTRPDPEAEAAAYFVIGEAMTNAFRHAAPTRVTVRGERRDGHLVVEVADDGRGGAAMLPGGGLDGLSARVGAAGGRLEVASPVGGGTRVRAELPWGGPR